jgi:hypothetical protein
MAQVAVVYESIYGNTRAVAEAMTEGLADLDAKAMSVHEASAGALGDAELVIVGGPTHMHGMASSLSRKMAVQAGEDDGAEIDPGAREELSLRAWLSQHESASGKAAAFDTRIDKSPRLTGTAARGIAKRLRRAGYELVADPESFFVEDSEGPLADGELDRAKEWGRAIAAAASLRSA